MQQVSGSPGSCFEGSFKDLVDGIFIEAILLSIEV